MSTKNQDAAAAVTPAPTPAPVAAPVAAPAITAAERDAIAREAEAEVKAKTIRVCACGECGQVVTRTFAPGHDAKLKARLVAAKLAALTAARTAAK